MRHTIGNCDECGNAETFLWKIRKTNHHFHRTVLDVGITYDPDAVVLFGPGFICMMCLRKRAASGKVDITLLEYRPPYRLAT